MSELPKWKQFTVSPDGDVIGVPERPTQHPVPDAEARRRAHLMAKGGNFAPDAEDFLAEGIAVARSGGNVRAWLEEQAKKGRRL